jgi:hypothetical protein
MMALWPTSIIRRTSRPFQWRHSARCCECGFRIDTWFRFRMDRWVQRHPAQCLTPHLPELS